MAPEPPAALMEAQDEFRRDASRDILLAAATIALTAGVTAPISPIIAAKFFRGPGTRQVVRGCSRQTGRRGLEAAEALRPRTADPGHARRSRAGRMKLVCVPRCCRGAAGGETTFLVERHVGRDEDGHGERRPELRDVPIRVLKGHH